MSSVVDSKESIAVPVQKSSSPVIVKPLTSGNVVTPVASSSACSPTTTTRTMSTLDLQSCNASELGQFLLTQRFQGSEAAAIEFLKHVEATLSSQPRKASSPQKPVAGNETTVEEELGRALTNTVEMSIVTPRAGKFQVTLHEEGLFGLKTNSKLIIPKNSVKNMIFFPKPEDCNKINKTKKVSSADLVLLRFVRAISFQNKSITQLCLQLPWEKTQGALSPTLCEGASDLNCDYDSTEAWKRVLTQSLGSDTETLVVARANNPSSGTTISSTTHSFQFASFSDPNSSSTTSGMPFVKCYHGVNDGVLYPLQEGLLFFKPPQFIPRSSMHSIACGRGSSSSSRYVDMVVELNADKADNDQDTGGTTVSFSNIQREEMGVLKEYIHDVLIPAMKSDAFEIGHKPGGGGGNSRAAGECSDEAQVEVSDENSEDEDDDNYDVDDEDEMDSDGSDEGVEDDRDDDGGGIEVVADEFAQELAKKKRMSDDGSATESESEDEPIAKRRRRRFS